MTDTWLVKLITTIIYFFDTFFIKYFCTDLSTLYPFLEKTVSNIGLACISTLLSEHFLYKSCITSTRTMFWEHFFLGVSVSTVTETGIIIPNFRVPGWFPGNRTRRCHLKFRILFPLQMCHVLTNHLLPNIGNILAPAKNKQDWFCF